MRIAHAIAAIVTVTGVTLGAARPLRIVCFGDSHTTVEAGFRQALANALQSPVQYVPEGLNGAKAQDLLSGLSGGPTFAPAVRWACAWQPDVIMVAFGTNEATQAIPAKNYEETFTVLLQEIHKTWPSAHLVVLGPPYGVPSRTPGLRLIRLAQASAARRAGAAWIDRTSLPAGPPRSDGVHYPAQGYTRLAQLVAAQVPLVLSTR